MGNTNLDWSSENHSVIWEKGHLLWLWSWDTLWSVRLLSWRPCAFWAYPPKTVCHFARNVPPIYAINIPFPYPPLYNCVYRKLPHAEHWCASWCMLLLPHSTLNKTIALYAWFTHIASPYSYYSTIILHMQSDSRETPPCACGKKQVLIRHTARN